MGAGKWLPFTAVRFYSAGFLDSAGADALHADFFAHDRTIFHHADGLDIRLKGSRRDLYNVHTDTAFFLCQTSADDGGAVKFLFTANFTYITHFNSP